MDNFNTRNPFQNKEGGDTDSEEEQEKLQEYEHILRQHDPNFAKYVYDHIYF